MAQPALHASTKLVPPITDHSGEMSLSVVHVVLGALIVVAVTLSIFAGVPFMTGLWIYPNIFGVEVPLATVILRFDG